ncbi:MAG: nuclear transport factor 2 family protein [Oscillospiraceae bacterium]|nr:nuclear transport factor 2 family protein [Oscillospiraceae bacterium]
MEDSIRAYFRSWIEKDEAAFQRSFSQDAVYSECYGPEYHGLPQLLRWFRDWNARGSVLSWEIKRFLKADRTAVAEWYFRCVFDGVEDGFDGVTIADFDAAGKIQKLSEFQSKAEHCCPYEE